MAKSYGGWYWRLGVASFVVIGGVIPYFGDYAHAQVTPDGTLGVENSVVTPTNVNGIPGDVINGGAARGANLFHSFEQFSIPTGGEAFFNNALDIQNIISRVTGLSISNIDGLLRANGTANLFLLNPNGIVFGSNATLSIGGSFVGTTANAIQFGNQGFFSASAPDVPPVLTVNPSAFFFNQIANAPIRNNSIAPAGLSPSGIDVTGLRVRDGQSLLLVGGDVTLENGGRLNANGGRVELGGLAGSGTVGLESNANNFSLSFVPSSLLSNVTLADDARVGVRGDGGGDIVVNANAFIATNGGRLVAGTEGPGNAGDITVNANNFNISGVGSSANGSGVYNETFENTLGNAGNVFINTRFFNASSGAQVESSTGGQGNAGSVTITASDSVSFDGVGSNGLSSGALSLVEAGSQGNGGNINITAGSLSLTNDAELNTSTSGQGNAGNIFVQASDSVTLANSNIFNNVGSGAVGDGGDINITAGSLSLIDGSQIQSSVVGASGELAGGRGNAGSVNINVSDTVTIAGRKDEGNPSGIYSYVESGAVGNGGVINIKSGSLSLTDGAVLFGPTFGQGDAGSVVLQVDESVSVIDSDIDTKGNRGSIAINAQSIDVTGESIISAGIGDDQGSVTTQAGDITLNAAETIRVAGSSVVLNTVSSGAVGKGGDINIQARSLSLNDGAAVFTDTFGQGDAGSISMQVDDSVSLANSSISSSVQSTASGKGGNIDIQARSLSLTDGAALVTGTSGRGDAGSVSIQASDVSFVNSYILNQNLGNAQGELAVSKAGDINIQTGSLSFSDNASLATSTNGLGDAGSVFIRASGPVSFASGSAISSAVGETGVGNGGDINILAQSLSLDDASVFTNTFGQGNAGSISVQANGFVSSTNNSGITTAVGQGAVGNGGNINISAGSLSLTDRTLLFTNTFGQGNAGSVSVQASDFVSLANSSISSSVGQSGVGNGSDINIQTRELSLTNGGLLNASTLGRGNAGSVQINVRDRVSFDGVGSDGSSSGAFSTVEEGAVGNGGGMNITTGSLSVTNGAVLNTSTFGQGSAGNLQVNAADSVELIGTTPNGQFVSGLSTDTRGAGAAGNLRIDTGKLIVRDGAVAAARTFGSGQGGTLTVNAADSVEIIGTTPNGEFVSGLFTNTFGAGAAGSLTIGTEQLTVRERAVVSVSSQGLGNAGNLQVVADSIRLDNLAALSADTTAGEGNIILRGDLVLRRGSNITTNATGTAEGGNISIDSDVIAALENSDISANSANSFGGRVTINAQGIFGTQFRLNPTLESDITASGGSPELSGSVDINNPDVDPSQGLVELPAELVDVSNSIAQGCPADGENKFIITGRGGLPPNPNEPLTGDNVLTEWNTLDSNAENHSSAAPATNSTKKSAPTTIVEANGWMTNDLGEVVLIATAPTATLDIPWLPKSDCNAPEPKS